MGNGSNGKNKSTPKTDKQDRNGDYILNEDGSHPLGKVPDKDGKFKPGLVKGTEGKPRIEQKKVEALWPTREEVRSARIFTMPLLPLSGIEGIEDLTHDERVFDSLIELARKLYGMGMSTMEVERAVLTHDSVHKPLVSRRLSFDERTEIAKTARLRNVSILDMTPEEHLANSLQFWSSLMRKAHTSQQKADTDIAELEQRAATWSDRLDRLSSEDTAKINSVVNARAQYLRQLGMAKMESMRSQQQMKECRGRMDNLLPISQSNIELVLNHKSADGSETTLAVRAEPISVNDEAAQIMAMYDMVVEQGLEQNVIEAKGEPVDGEE